MRRGKKAISMNRTLLTPFFLLTSVISTSFASIRQRHHHLYRQGHAPDSCVTDSDNKHYWTGPAHPRGKSLIGTNYALNLIFALQNPDNCSAANFLLWVPVRHGIGSNTHVMGQTLAHALSLGRVLITMQDEEHPFYDTQYCASQDDYHDCYFEPLSRCTLEDVRQASGAMPDILCPTSKLLWDGKVKQGLDVQNIDQVPELTYGEPESFSAHQQSKIRVIKLSKISHDDKHLPRPLMLFLSGSTLLPDKHFYWWRAVSTAYIMRPNERTLRAIEDRKRAIYPEMAVPQGCIATHIRRGDKWKETDPVDDNQYLSVIKGLRKEEGDDWSLSQHIYLSTEDQSSVEFFEKLSAWNVTYTHVQRYVDKDVSPMDFADKIGRSNEMLNSLVSLDLALQCDAFVMTLSSNWCRLIDELRATIRCKAANPFWDAQQNNTLANYDVGWR